MSLARRVRDGLLVSALALTVAVVLAEVVVRAVGLAAEGGGEEKPRLSLDPSLRGLPTLVTTSELSRPDVRGVHYGVLHRTNSRGVRGPEFSPKPASGTFRIALVGDSIAMGHRVDESDTYAVRLARSLNAQSRGVTFEVINASLSGHAIGGVLRRLRSVALPYHPNLVVYGFSTNDIYGGAYVSNTPAEREAFRREHARFVDAPLHLLRVLWPGWVAFRSALDPLPGSHEYALERAYFEHPEAWERIADGLDQLAEIGAEQSVCVHIFVQLVIQQLNFLHPFRRIYDHVEAAALERGLTASQSVEHFLGRSADEVRFAPDDKHPTPEGHRLFALALEEGLRNLPPRCGFPL